MDSTLLGVIIGSSISLFGNIISHLYLLRKETIEWKHQQRVEREKRTYEAEKELREKKLSTYHKCIQTLSLIITSEFNKEELDISDEKQLDLYQEAHKWLTLVAIFYMDKRDEEIVEKFFSELKHFTENKEKFSARELRVLVLSLVKIDKDLFPNISERDDDPNEISISIHIDKEFRRCQFVEGIDLPQNYAFKVNLNDLTPKQRSLLWDLYFDSYQGIPKSLGGLSVPSYNEKNKKIIVKGKSWAARINPYLLEPTEIMNAWQIDYENTIKGFKSLYEINN